MFNITFEDNVIGSYDPDKGYSISSTIAGGLEITRNSAIVGMIAPGRWDSVFDDNDNPNVTAYDKAMEHAKNVISWNKVRAVKYIRENCNVSLQDAVKAWEEINNSVFSSPRPGSNP